MAQEFGANMEDFCPRSDYSPEKVEVQIRTPSPPSVSHTALSGVWFYPYNHLYCRVHIQVHAQADTRQLLAALCHRHSWPWH